MSTIDTRILEARGAFDQAFNAEALRDPFLGLLNVAKRSRLLSSINQNLLENSWNKPSTAIPVIGRTTPTVTVGIPGCNDFGDSINETAMVRPTFAEFYVAISMFDTEADNNEFSYDALFGRKLHDAEQQLAQEIETRLFTLLNTNKATTYNSELVGAGTFYPLAGDNLQVAGANQDRFFSDFPSIMASDDFGVMDFDVVATPSIGRWLNYNVNQGQSNNQNLAFQFDSYDYEFSRFIPATSAVNAVASGFIMPKDTIGMYGRTGGSYAKNSQVGGGVQSWGTMESEKCGITLNVGKKQGCGDASLITGNTLDVSSLKEQWVLTASVVFLTPYNAGRTNSAIKGFDYV